MLLKSSAGPVCFSTDPTAASITDKLTDIDITGSTNTVTATKSGASQHDTTLGITGSSNTVSVTQSGAEASTVDVTTNGSSSSVTITVTD